MSTPEELFDEMIAMQEKKLLQMATDIVGDVTADDILQPNDFPELENHPFFRYEEGALKGLQAAQAAYRAWKRSNVSSS